MSILKLKNVCYSYDRQKQVLNNISYEFEKGKLYVIVGRSGAGKTTMLSLLSGLTSPSAGEITFGDTNIQNIDRFEYRSRYVGVIFQQFNLLPHLNAIENVELSIRASGKKIANKNLEARALLSKVGLNNELASRRILKLSGGEQQRVAIARALSYDPDIILADEPTGNLDLATQEEIMDIFNDLAHRDNKCVIIVSHSPEVASSADEVYELTKLNETQKKSDAKEKTNERGDKIEKIVEEDILNFENDELNESIKPTEEKNNKGGDKIVETKEDDTSDVEESESRGTVEVEKT